MKKKQGRLNRWLQWIVHILSLLPLAALIGLALSGKLGFNPVETVLRWTGRIAVILLLLSLACTPVNKIFGQPKIGRLRKPLGLYAALYAVLHFAAFAIWDYGLNLRLIWSEILSRPFILWGLGGLVILLVLAATSFRFWQRKLGKTWRWLHRLVYAAGVLILIHYLLAIKGDLFSLQGAYLPPLIAGSILILLFILRIPAVYRFIRRLF